MLLLCLIIYLNKFKHAHGTPLLTAISVHCLLNAFVSIRTHWWQMEPTQAQAITGFGACAKYQPLEDGYKHKYLYFFLNMCHI